MTDRHTDIQTDRQADRQTDRQADRQTDKTDWGPQNVIHPQKVKQCYVLRDPHLRFWTYAVEIIITFCAKLLRSGLSLTF